MMSKQNRHGGTGAQGGSPCNFKKDDIENSLFQLPNNVMSKRSQLNKDYSKEMKVIC